MSKIHIKDSHKGRFKSWAKIHGMTVAEAVNKVTKHKDEYSKHVDLMATFAKNFGSKNKKAMGGQVFNSITPNVLRKPKVLSNGGQVPIEAEDDEVKQTPNGVISQYDGATHESGGIDDVVPQGTNIYSDRLSVDGQTMAERKLARERSLNKLKKLSDRRPVDALVKNATNRIQIANQAEEEQDMAMQEMANRVYKQPSKKAAFGGKMYANGTGLDGVDDGTDDNTGGLLGGIGNLSKIISPQYTDYGSSVASPQDKPDPITPDTVPNPMGNMDMILPNTSVAQQNNGMIGPQQDNNIGSPTGTPNNSWQAQALGTNQIPDSSFVNNLGGTNTGIKAPMTAGNIAGMIGTGINTIAPLINSKNYWKNRVQPTNSYLGYNHDALETNESELNTLSGEKELAQSTNLRNRTNSINRNNNSIRSLNTQRALNSGTDILANEDDNKISQGFASQKLGILGQRAGLQTQRDAAIMGGNNQVQNQNRSDIENYYTNKGKDITNIGTGLQKEGLAMNEQQHNQDFMTILPMLSKYGLGISYVNGKPTLVNS